mgnify:CR=1 FL=1
MGKTRSHKKKQRHRTKRHRTKRHRTKRHRTKRHRTKRRQHRLFKARGLFKNTNMRNIKKLEKELKRLRAESFYRPVKKIKKRPLTSREKDKLEEAALKTIYPGIFNSNSSDSDSYYSDSDNDSYYSDSPKPKKTNKSAHAIKSFINRYVKRTSR